MHEVHKSIKVLQITYQAYKFCSSIDIHDDIQYIDLYSYTE